MRTKIVSLLIVLSMFGFIAAIATPSGAADAVVSGVVQFSGGAPIANAQVSLSDPNDPDNEASAVSDANGAYVFNVPPGSYQLSVGIFSAAGLAGGTSASLLVLNGNATENITFPAAATVAVHVVDSTNAPVAGATVSRSGDTFTGPPLSDGTAMTFGTHGGPAIDPTDANGNTSFLTLLGDPALGVQVTAPGSFPVSTTVDVATDPTNVTVAIPAGVAVSGVVKDSAGAPIAGANVSLFDSSNIDNEADVTSDAGGAYAFHVPPGSYSLNTSVFTLAGSAGGHTASPLVVTGDLTEDITFPAVATVAVHVIDSTNAPIADASVITTGDTFTGPPLSDGTAMTFSGHGGATGATDAGGDTSFLALLGDPAVGVRVSAPGSFPVSTTVNVAADLTNVTVPIPGGLVVSGVVRDSAGTPVPANVSLIVPNDADNEADATSDAGGAYAFHVPPGTYQLGVTTIAFGGIPGGSSASPLVVNGNLTENITFPTAATVAVHVVDSTNAPVAGASVFTSGDTFTGPPLSDGTAMHFATRPFPAGATDAGGDLSFLAMLGDPALGVQITAPGSFPVNTTVNVATDPTNLAIGIGNLNGATITSLGSASGAVTASSPPGTQLFNVSQQVVAASSLPAGSVALIGALSYTVSGAAPGATVDVVLQLPAGSNPTGVYKLQNGTYTNVSSIATISGNQITLHLRDGGPADADGLANGVLVDPIVPFGGGGSTPAPPVAPAVPKLAPGAPTKVVAIPGNGRTTISWTAPKANGGPAISGYQVVPILKGKAAAAIVLSGTSLKSTITGLKNGLTYTFKVAARNSIGLSSLSAASPAVTIGAPVAPATPKVARVAAGSVKVTAVAPNSNGAKITSYTASCTSSNGGATKSHADKTSKIVVSGLTKGKKYTCTVKATNSRGTGPASKASAVVKP